MRRLRYFSILHCGHVKFGCPLGRCSSVTITIINNPNSKLRNQISRHSHALQINCPAPCNGLPVVVVVAVGFASTSLVACCAAAIYEAAADGQVNWAAGRRAH